MYQLDIYGRVQIYLCVALAAAGVFSGAQEGVPELSYPGAAPVVNLTDIRSRVLSFQSHSEPVDIVLHQWSVLRGTSQILTLYSVNRPTSSAW